MDLRLVGHAGKDGCATIAIDSADHRCAQAALLSTDSFAQYIKTMQGLKKARLTCDQDAGWLGWHSLLQDLFPDQVQQRLVKGIAMPAGQEAGMHTGPRMPPARPPLWRMAHPVCLQPGHQSQLKLPNHAGCVLRGQDAHSRTARRLFGCFKTAALTC